MPPEEQFLSANTWPLQRGIYLVFWKFLERCVGSVFIPAPSTWPPTRTGFYPYGFLARTTDNERCTPSPSSNNRCAEGRISISAPNRNIALVHHVYINSTERPLAKKKKKWDVNFVQVQRLSINTKMIRVRLTGSEKCWWEGENVSIAAAYFRVMRAGPPWTSIRVHNFFFFFFKPVLKPWWLG